MKALVVDGYNAIHKIPYLKKIVSKNLQDARAGITELAKEYQRKRGGIDKVYVVFDGRDVYRDNEFQPHPHQIFSGTSKGDEEVVRTVKNLSGKYHVEVVTDDNFIRNNSRAYKATVLPVSEFLSFLNKKKSNIDKQTIGEKALPKKASAINEELKKHWGI